jgi:hypothetical protein
MLTPVEIRLQNATSSFCLRTYFKLTLLIKKSFVRSTRYGTKPETFAVMRPKRQSSVMFQLIRMEMNLLWIMIGPTRH